jgi:hypothetical protein
MKVDAKIDTTKVKAMMQKMPDKVEKGSKSGLAKAAAYVEFIIKQRTARGMGVNRAFIPYSESYKIARAKHGRGTSPVDLNWSGRMLAAVTWKVKSAKLAIVTFSSGLEAKKAMFHHKMGAGKGRVKRPWFDINASEVRKVKQVFDKELHKYLKRAA